jgi:hypothetical protein
LVFTPTVDAVAWRAVRSAWPMTHIGLPAAFGGGPNVQRASQCVDILVGKFQYICVILLAIHQLLLA